MRRFNFKSIVLSTLAASAFLGCAHQGTTGKPPYLSTRAKPPYAARVEGPDYTPPAVRGATFGNPPGTGVMPGAVKAVRASQGTREAFSQETADARP